MVRISIVPVDDVVNHVKPVEWVQNEEQVPVEHVDMDESEGVVHILLEGVADQLQKLEPNLPGDDREVDESDWAVENNVVSQEQESEDFVGTHVLCVPNTSDLQDENGESQVVPAGSIEGNHSDRLGLFQPSWNFHHYQSAQE